MPLDPRDGSLSSIPARELAEFTSGVRGQYLSLSREGDRLQVLACPGTTPCAPLDDPRNPVIYTPLRRPDRPGPATVSAIVDDEVHWLVGPDAANPSSPPDSLFWTDAAVEKLMVPYYASVKGRSSPIFVPQLLGRSEGLVQPTQRLSTASSTTRGRSSRSTCPNRRPARRG